MNKICIIIVVFKGFVLFKDFKYLYVGKSVLFLRDFEFCEKNKCKKCYVYVILIYILKYRLFYIYNFRIKNW